MCGIAGILETTNRRPDEAALERMIKAIAHRGPDGSQVHVAPPIGLGHARLRVLDLTERADQPMWNETKTIAIVFNGEIYNHRQLRKELEGPELQFNTRSDTEVILKLYEHCGSEAVRRLDGMFALAIWDGRSRSLLLARDRLGKKPLFYYHDSRRFAFGSEIKAIHAHPEIGRDANLELLPWFLTYGYFPGPATAYLGVYQVPPAAILVVDGKGRIETRTYWKPTFHPDGVIRKSEAIEELRTLASQAVDKRLDADVPVGAMLSGGVDSTMIVGLMSRSLSRPVRTFSIGFADQPDFDETRYAEIAARAFETDHTTFKMGPPEGELLERLVHHHDGPFGDSSAIPTYTVSRLARKHVTVMLNGDGGDELFAGYDRFRAALAAERFPLWLRAFGRRVGEFLPEAVPWCRLLQRTKRFLDAAWLPLDERYLRWCSCFPDASRDLLHTTDPEAEERLIAEHFRRHLREVADATPLSRLLYLNMRTYLPEDLLVKMDRSTMAHGLEARSPFLDPSLVEFAGRLPDRFKLRGLTTKVLLREAYRDLIPGPILSRSKRGFGVPLGAWLRGPLRSYSASRLGSPQARILEFVRRGLVSSHLEAHLSGVRDFGQRLFSLLTLEIWLRSL